MKRSRRQPSRHMRLTSLFVLVLVAVTPRPAAAHGIGMSQVAISIDGTHVTGDWNLNLNDARGLVGLDPRVGGDAGWNELRSHEPELRAALAPNLTLLANGTPCPVRLTDAPLERVRDLGDVRLHLVAECAVAPTRLTIRNNLLFDRDPKHRAYFSIEDDRVTSVGVLRAGQRSVTVDVHQFHALPTIAEFVREGAHHIWTGVDHLLFLVALLLPAPLLRTPEGWSPRPAFLASAREVTKVVTAFTAAHSLTLCLAFFRVLTPPAQWVETGIAVSVFAAAWNNLRPFLPRRAWWIAFGFGLVHGLGFAGALGNLSLPRHARGLALGSFNVGVEVGQLAIVAVVLPLLYAASRHRRYPRLVMGAGSLVIAWLAFVWTLERGVGLSLLPHR